MGPVNARPLEELVHPSWLPAHTPVAPTIAAIGDFLREEVAAGRGYLPSGDNVLRGPDRTVAACWSCHDCTRVPSMLRQRDLHPA